MTQSLDSSSVQKIVQDTRTFAFVDVLGYGSVVCSGTMTDQSRITTIVQIWENLLASVKLCKDIYSGVDTVLFSDSLYVAHTDPLVTAGFVASLYHNVASYYESHPTHWMPWLRAGITMGWAIDVMDPTVPFNAGDPAACYRNPVGPGPANAYFLAEKTQMKGARILVDGTTYTNITMSARGVTASDSLAVQHAASKLQRPWPLAGNSAMNGVPCDLYDLPWWRLMTGGNSKAVQVFQNHVWQIPNNDSRAKTHLDNTLRVLQAGG